MSLIAHWKMDDLKDYSGNGNDLVYLNNSSKLVSNQVGKLGECYSRNVQSDGNDYLRSTNKVNLKGQYTMSCWAYVTDCVGDTANGLITNHNHSTNVGGGITVKEVSLTDFRISCNTGTGSSRTYNSYYGTTNIKDRWSHLVMRYKNNSFQLYVDGELEYSRSYNMAIEEDYIALFAWSLGYLGSASYRPASKIDDVRIYDHALSTREVKELAKAKVLHYKFDNFVEPTENVVTNTNLDTGWSKGYCTGIQWNDIEPPKGIDSPVVSFYDNDTNQNAYWYSYGDYAPQLPNTTYTVSMYIKTNDSNFSIRFYTANNSELGRYSSEYITVPNDGKWHRIIWNSFTNSSDSESDSLSFNFSFGNTQGEGQRTWFCAPQMEAKDHATPFVDGTRTDNTITDSSGQDNNGVVDLSNPPRWTDGYIGKGSYEFNGNNQRIDINSTLQIKAQEVHSYSAWIKLSSDWSNEGIIFGGARSTSNAFGILPDRKLYAREDDEYIDSTVTINTDEWTHVAYTLEYDGGSTITQSLYINGELDNSRLDTGYVDGYVNTNNFIGYDTRFSFYFNGIIDDVRVYKTLLSPDDIKQLYQQRASIDSNGNFNAHMVEEYYTDENEVDTTEFRALAYPYPEDLEEGLFDVSSGIKLFDYGRAWHISVWDRRIDDWATGINFYSAEWSDGTHARFDTYDAGQRAVQQLSFVDTLKNLNSDYIVVLAGSHAPEHVSAEMEEQIKRCGGSTELISQIDRCGYICVGIVGCGENNAITEVYDNRIDTVNGNELYAETSFLFKNEKIQLKNNGSFRSKKYSEVGITDGLVAYYPLDNNADDYSINNNNATSSSMIFEDGIIDKARASGSATVPSDTAFNVKGDMTLSFWFRPDASGARRVVMQTAYAGSFCINHETAGDLRFYNGNDSSYQSLDSSVLTNGEWYYCVAVRDGSARRWYLNGELDTSDTTSYDGGTRVDNLTLGTGYTGNEIIGGLDEVRIYDRVLTEEEILINYKMTNPNNKERVIESNKEVFTRAQISEVNI